MDGKIEIKKEREREIERREPERNGGNSDTQLSRRTD